MGLALMVFMYLLEKDPLLPRIGKNHIDVSEGKWLFPATKRHEGQDVSMFQGSNRAFCQPLHVAVRIGPKYVDERVLAHFREKRKPWCATAFHRTYLYANSGPWAVRGGRKVRPQTPLTNGSNRIAGVLWHRFLVTPIACAFSKEAEC